MLFAFDVPYPQAFAFDDDAWIDAFVRFVLAKMMPDMCAVSFDDMRRVVCERMVILVRNSIKTRGCGESVSDWPYC
jgi:hypothetical protein